MTEREPNDTGFLPPSGGGGGGGGGGGSGSGGGGGGGDSGGDSGGSSGGSSSGGSSSPPVDPVIAQKKSQFGSLYFQLWGEPATDAYLTQAAKSGMNIWEFALRERSKPAYFTTKHGKDQVFSWVEKMANAGL